MSECNIKTDTAYIDVELGWGEGSDGWVAMKFLVQTPTEKLDIRNKFEYISPKDFIEIVFPLIENLKHVSLRLVVHKQYYYDEEDYISFHSFEGSPKELLEEIKAIGEDEMEDSYGCCWDCLGKEEFNRISMD